MENADALEMARVQVRNVVKNDSMAKIAREERGEQTRKGDKEISYLA